MIIEQIDEIARRLGHDVLFADVAGEAREAIFYDHIFDFRVEDMEHRNAVIAFLEAEGIGWKPCYGFSSRSGWLFFPYYGSIFIDLPNDQAGADYRKVCDFFEDTEGEPLFRDYHLFLLPLRMAKGEIFSAHPTTPQEQR